MRCPLYTGEALPSIPAAAAPAPLPQSGVKGWLSGLSPRDRRIYGGLIGLLGLIIIAYVVGAVVYFSDETPITGDPGATATTSPSPTQPAPTPAPASPAAASATPTANGFATAVARQTATAQAIQSRTPTGSPSVTASPSVTGSPSPSATQAPSVPPSDTPVIIDPPTDTPQTIPSDTPIVAPSTNTPTDEPATAAPSTNTPTDEPTTAVPTVTATPAPPTDTPTDGPPTATPTEIIIPTDPPTPEFPTLEPPTPTPGSAEPLAAPVSALTLFYADPSGRVLVPVTRRIDTTRQPRTSALSELIAGPRGALGRLVPADTRLLGLRIAGGLATANFNRLPTFGGNAATDPGLQAVVLALTEQTDVTQVQLQVNGANIGGPRYRPNVNADNPQRLDGQFSSTSFLPLYFPSAGTGQMVRVIRFVPRTKAEARATLEQLIAGPGQFAGALAQPIPPSTAINRLAISGGVAEVDLSAAFLASPDRAAAARSITLALTTFPSV
ncbi:MAG TPA: GerMN domain-containing protein, partial [Herpetosiphonaceae bacterium]